MMLPLCVVQIVSPISLWYVRGLPSELLNVVESGLVTSPARLQWNACPIRGLVRPSRKISRMVCSQSANQQQQQKRSGTPFVIAYRRHRIECWDPGDVCNLTGSSRLSLAFRPSSMRRISVTWQWFRRTPEYLAVASVPVRRGLPKQFDRLRSSGSRDYPRQQMIVTGTVSGHALRNFNFSILAVNQSEFQL